MSLASKAFKVVEEYHKDQKYGNLPYSCHILNVYLLWADLFSMNTQDCFIDEIVTVCYLHDILEDTDYTEEQLKAEFGSFVHSAVKALTKGEDESQESYLRRVKANPVAVQVKIADAMSNLQQCLKEDNFNRARKYSNILKVIV